MSHDEASQMEASSTSRASEELIAYEVSRSRRNSHSVEGFGVPGIQMQYPVSTRIMNTVRISASFVSEMHQRTGPRAAAHRSDVDATRVARRRGRRARRRRAPTPSVRGVDEFGSRAGARAGVHSI